MFCVKSDFQPDIIMISLYCVLLFLLLRQRLKCHIENAQIQILLAKYIEI